ncbi:8-oxo-dGTP diphosphatase MutT [Pseudalkalibacillus hwajinpoensis]|uniref:8-oxo-dGTP diphosphatase MutT n=1 Tax=Guptibacillus hwajinpoensis TaxID=208199 RepID=UPI001CD601A9|nr:8-oxo-dGTP diphosphatase MutT [Pseudalkalibacillus hwajinpoensis]
MMKKVKVVGAVIRNKQDEFLCALRSPTMSLPNLWEFPGGKIEEGETPEQTLIREIEEELDCEISVQEKVEEVLHEYPNVIVNLLTYESTIINGEPKAKEHAKLEWVSKNDLRSLEWAPADIPTIDKLLSN